VAREGGARWTMAWLAMAGLADFCERIEVFTPAGVHALEFPAPYLHQAPTRYSFSRGRRDGNATTTFRSWQEAYRRQLEAFRACIAHDEPCLTPPEQARADIVLLTSLHEAAEAVGAAR
jgi:predicted dehydrogenase